MNTDNLPAKNELHINGGHPISGVHRVPGNKNAALPMLAATLLTDEPVTLENLPLISDVSTTLDLLRDIGAEVSLDSNARRVTVCTRKIAKTSLDPELCAKVRATILFAGPMVARAGRIEISAPGGDPIGRRRIDTHIAGLAALGATLFRTGENNGYGFFADGRMHGAEIILDEASVTATENILMAAAAAEGETTIYNAACEPHVQDLCRMLCAMGAQISGIGTNLLRIDGVPRLHGATARIGYDYIDAASYMAASLVTGGALTVKGVSERDFGVLRKACAKFGVRWEIDGDTLHLPVGQRLAVVDDFGGAIPKIEDGIWPSIPSDLMSILIVLALFAEGTTIFFEKMFESRMYFVDNLINMGAKIVQCDPHRIVVVGSHKPALSGCTVTSPDIRAGIALVIAALGARGKSVIQNAQSIDRGYEDVEKNLSSLGASVERIMG